MSFSSLRGQPLPKMGVLSGLAELETGDFIGVSPPSQRTGSLQLCSLKCLEGFEQKNRLSCPGLKRTSVAAGWV